ncbi:hypothetical protein [Erysipelothrix anatis]|uniref:hypothetical protein n=1 Tax=Erysipelothrix anatis TaxID=2683713 RepID=UPI00135B9104|nr:hypothetical protein [Erysipelothrix anatis]
MKRRYKVLLLVIVVLGIISMMGIIDYNRIVYDRDASHGFKEPLFSLRVGNAGGGFTNEYRGLLYWIRVGTEGKDGPLEDYVYKCIDPFPLSLVQLGNFSFCGEG